ncbi:YidH family protein [Arthrobacter sp. NPDC090010]|uniref:YidH family protein n=1 Tax=Arthrobacter sp. NPDC090010 TaxID=3363942 RepID=UPI003807DEAA
MRQPRWRQEGTAPDYRFSLANERTFLAWLRTSLALLAGAVAVDQLAPGIAPVVLRVVLCVLLALIGAALAAMAYRRWAQAEDAMRHGRELPFSWVLLVMSVVVVIAALVLAVLILVRH